MASAAEFEVYKAHNVASINALLADMGCRPVLFVGSGLTRRYLGGPSWFQLLEQISNLIGMDSARFAFLSQNAGSDPIVLGTLISDEVHSWAFGPGKNSFPSELFTPDQDKDIFIKTVAARLLADLAGNVYKLDGVLKEELDLLQKSSPHALITTNYDPLLEMLFPEFEKVVGEKIIPFSLNIFGELYKIHGTIDDPSSLVLTGKDYDRYRLRRKYISSKLMTYFAEYPLFIFGYSLSDRNVNAIISDLGEALRDKDGLLENVYYIQYSPDIASLSSLQTEYAVPAADEGAPPLRVRTIVTDRFDWILAALGDTANPMPMPTKALRHLAARVIELVRVDVPKNKIEIDYDQIKRLSESPNELAQVLGISNVQSPNVEYPYSLTEIGKKLGFTSWHKANDLIKIADERLGYKLKASDNEYHLAFKGGVKNEFHKYSEAGYQLLKMIKEETAPHLDLMG